MVSLLNLKDKEKQLKCWILLKHLRGRAGAYMQFKLEGKDIASGQLKGKCCFSNLLQMEMSSQLGWPGSPRDQAAGKRFGGGKRATSGPALFLSLLPTTRHRESTRNRVCTVRIQKMPTVLSK